MPRDRICKYEAYWPTDATDLAIEMACIQMGGRWTKEGRECGMGLAYHYNAMRRIIWPHLDDHRWVQLCLKEALASKILTIIGAGSTGKTNFAAWYGLCSYYCFPRETLVMVSSTDLRGLQLRVFGEIKQLHSSAQDRFDLPGKIIESKCAISTDDIDEDQVRDLRCGVIGIPTVNNGKQVGLQKWVGVKQKRVLLIADECFPAGTMVDTPTGPKAIETIEAGQQVLNASGIGTVIGVSCRTANSLVRIKTTDGRQIVCTPNHQFFTNRGWVKAIDMNCMGYIFGVHEAMHLLQGSIPEERQPKGVQPMSKIETRTALQGMWKGICGRKTEFDSEFLQSELLGQMEPETTWSKGGVLLRRAESQIVEIQNTVVERESRTRRHDVGTDEEAQSAFGENLPEQNSRIQGQTLCKTSTNRSGISDSTHAEIGASNSQYAHSSENERVCAGALLLNRYCHSRHQVGHRSGWSQPCIEEGEIDRFKKRSLSNGAWVESIEILKSDDFKKDSDCGGGVEVYNLHVEKHHSYSVSGLLCKNCQFMNSTFLSAFANLDKNVSFRAICIGNPNDILDPLGKAAEPKDGWGSHMEPEKTAVWDTRFMNGRCVNLIGTDSPNFDDPPGTPTRFPYLISREKIANTIAFFSKDSVEYFSQCIGAMKTGTLLKRVLTRELCTKFNANSRDIVWDGPTTKICGLDAAYGGDRCVTGYIEFGKAISGKVMLLINPPVLVPILGTSGTPPEDQIAIFIKEFCRRNSIPPENFFHDSTGRGSLGTALARIWSAQCNPIEFGGSPTSRPVSLDLYIWDQDAHRRRLKRCDEHYSKFVTELWFSVRYAVEADQVRALPEDVMEEFCMREWNKVKADKIELEKKEDMKERVGRSPDLADWCSICMEGARQRGFVVSRLVNAEAQQTSREWLRDLEEQAGTLKSHALVYR